MKNTEENVKMFLTYSVGFLIFILVESVIEFFLIGNGEHLSLIGIHLFKQVSSQNGFIFRMAPSIFLLLSYVVFIVICFLIQYIIYKNKINNK